MINRLNVRWRNRLCFMLIAVVTGGVRCLIRHAAYTARHILCMTVSCAAGLPALKSVIGVPNSDTDLVCFSVCAHSYECQPFLSESTCAGLA